jgi:hypothetical protein
MVQAPEWASTTSARTGLIAPTLTADDLLTALRDRRIFATTDANFALAFKANDVWQGSELAQACLLNFEVFVVDTEAEEATLIVYDRTTPLLQTTQPTDSPWQFQIETLPGHFYWIEARQSDGDVALTAPIWIAGEMPPETIYLNELLPDPDDIDWDGDGTVDSTDEWIELFNPGEHAIG